MENTHPWAIGTDCNNEVMSPVLFKLKHGDDDVAQVDAIWQWQQLHHWTCVVESCYPAFNGYLPIVN